MIKSSVKSQLLVDGTSHCQTWFAVFPDALARFFEVYARMFTAFQYFTTPCFERSWNDRNDPSKHGGALGEEMAVGRRGGGGGGLGASSSFTLSSNRGGNSESLLSGD